MHLGVVAMVLSHLNWQSSQCHCHVAFAVSLIGSVQRLVSINNEVRYLNMYSKYKNKPAGRWGHRQSQQHEI